MRRSDRLLLLAFAALPACSFTGPRVTECTENATCRDAFGLTWVCGDAGYCETAPAFNRCTQTYPEDLLTRPEDYAGIPILGALADVTADNLEVQAIELPFTQADDQGGLDGTTIGLVTCTYETDSALDNLDYDGAVLEIARYLVDVIGVPAVIGPITSGTTTNFHTEANEVMEADVLIVSPSATSPALTVIDGITKSDQDPGLMWRTCPPDSLQGAAAAQYIGQQGKDRVAVVYQTGPYGSGLAEAFLDNFVATGGAATAYEFDSETAIGVAIDELASVGTYEEVFFISSEVSDIIYFLNSLSTRSQFDVPGFGIFLADGAADIQLIEETSDATGLYDQIRGSRPSVPPSAIYDSFAGSYFSAYGDYAEDSIYTAYAYDASWLAMYAVAWSTFNEGGLSGTGMARGMRKVSQGIDVEIRPTGWATATAAFEEAQGIDVVGVSGELDYDPVDEETTSPIEIWAINAGRDGFDVIDTVYPDGG